MLRLELFSLAKIAVSNIVERLVGAAVVRGGRTVWGERYALERNNLLVEVETNQSKIPKSILFDVSPLTYRQLFGCRPVCNVVCKCIGLFWFSSHRTNLRRTRLVVADGCDMATISRLLNEEAMCRICNGANTWTGLLVTLLYQYQQKMKPSPEIEMELTAN